MADIVNSSAAATERTPLVDSEVRAESEAQRLQDEEANETTPSSPLMEDNAPDFSIITTLLLGVFVGNVDSTLVMAQTGPISSEFNDLAKAEWLVSSFFLASCAAQPVIGKLSDIYGRKTMLLISYAFFTVGNFLSGAGAEMWLVLLGRVIAGVGGGGATSLVSIIIADLVPIRSIAAWRSYVNVAATTGRSFGGPLGGILADTVGWRWSFYGQCPLTMLAFLLVVLRLPAAHDSQTSQVAAKDVQNGRFQKLYRIDFFGAVTLIGATLTFLLGLEVASRSISNISTVNILLWAVSLAFIVSFVLIEWKVAREPIFPVRLMLNRDVVTSNLVGILQMIAQVELMFVVPLYFQITMNASATDAGTRLVPAVVGNALGGLICGLGIKKTGRYKLLTIGGLLFSCLGYALVIVRWHGHTNWAESIYIFPGGFGMGVVQSSTFIALTAGVSREDYAVAGSGLYQTMGIGGSMGSCITMAILQATLRPLLQHALAGIGNEEKVIKRAIQDIYYVQSLKGRLREIVVSCYIQALTWTHVSSLVFSFLALCVSFLMKERPV